MVIVELMADGPLFVTINVYIKLLPGATIEAEAVLLKLRSAFAELDSVKFCVVVMLAAIWTFVAVLGLRPLADAVTV